MIDVQHLCSSLDALRHAKLLPHVVFPQANLTVFVDMKLVLHADPLALATYALRRTSERHAVSFAAFRHVCVASPVLQVGLYNPCSRAVASTAADWVVHEAQLVANASRVDDGKLLLRQANVYAAQWKADSNVYVDAALLLLVSSVPATRTRPQPFRCLHSCSWARSSVTPQTWK